MTQSCRLPLRSDTNALWITERLSDVGVEVGARVTVADDPGLLESAFRNALSRAFERDRLTVPAIRR